MEQALEGADAVHRVKRPRVAKVVEAPAAEYDAAAQAYALRIWEGQSVDVPVPERVARVMNGLCGQGLSLAVTLPHPDAARFLAQHT